MIVAEYNLECYQLDYNTVVLIANVTEEMDINMAP